MGWGGAGRGGTVNHAHDLVAPLTRLIVLLIAVPGAGWRLRFVIFDARQQQLEYLLQFHFADEPAPMAAPSMSGVPQWLQEAESGGEAPPPLSAAPIDLADVMGVPSPLAKVRLDPSVFPRHAIC